MRVAIDLWPGYYPLLLADNLGWLAERGVRLRIAVPGNTDRMIAQFAAGGHDLVAVALGDLINLTRGRRDVKVVLVSDESAGGDVLLLRPGGRLGGGRLRVGTNLGGFGELFVEEFLLQRGLDLSNVLWVNVDAADVPRALAAGDLDLGHCWEPYASQALAEGASRVFSSAETPGLIPDVVATTGALIESRRADLVAVVAAWLQAIDWWDAHPGEARRRLSERLGRPPESISLEGVRLLRAADNRERLVDPPQSLAATVRRYSDFFVRRGSLTRPLQPGSLLDGSLLP